MSQIGDSSQICGLMKAVLHFEAYLGDLLGIVIKLSCCG
ncbi:unnamed protein product [Acidithrix sp. C25]|nr:unnamed protein product [Acidithrix sp. C25]